ncbi:MAG TPA: hypothetical protein VGH82_16385 [Gaiellaceae bacterium]|jgi:hypothetical protein
MEREKTGVELLLSEPEIVAWLGLDEIRGDGTASASGSSRGARVDWQVARARVIQQTIGRARVPRVGIVL